MDIANGIERLDQAIAKGEAVLNTHRPLPPNAFGFPTLDSGAFNEWRTQALVCLKSLFGDKHTYVEHFDEQVKQGYQVTGPTWQGKPLVLVLDHRNGDRSDNRLDNLRLLCPNCNSQQATFAGKNKGRYGVVVPAKLSEPDASHGSSPD